MLLANWFVENLFNWLGAFGLAGQFAFMMRFVVQWFASERRGRSYMPIAFWYFSILGGLMLFTYATFKRDPVIMLGQLLGLTIYSRNLILIYRRRWRIRRRFGSEPGPLLGEMVDEETTLSAPSDQA
jgi:lipid-A-disaccharide synthase-like uncharacterized protein